MLFSTLHEEASENGPVFSDYLCLRKRRFLISRFKRTRHSIALRESNELVIHMEAIIPVDQMY